MLRQHNTSVFTKGRTGESQTACTALHSILRAMALHSAWKSTRHAHHSKVLRSRSGGMAFSEPYNLGDHSSKVICCQLREYLKTAGCIQCWFASPANSACVTQSATSCPCLWPWIGSQPYSDCSCCPLLFHPVSPCPRGPCRFHQLAPSRSSDGAYQCPTRMCVVSTQLAASAQQ